MPARRRKSPDEVRVEALADALRGLVALTGEPDLSVGTAAERGLLDWQSIAA